MDLPTALKGAIQLAKKYDTTVIVHWKGNNRYGFATEIRLLSGKRRLSRWRYRVFPDGRSERL